MHLPNPPVPAARTLPWPPELPAALPAQATQAAVPESNLLLDLHGSPREPELVLFMAGNQYRVLPGLIAAFGQWLAAQGLDGPRPERIFYATLPPGRLIDAMESGVLALGNCWFEVAPQALWPDVFMTGPREHARLHRLGHIDGYSLYARNRGAALLVRKGNPLAVRTVADLARDDVRVAVSSPQREPASWESYRLTLAAQGGAELPARVLGKPNTVSPQSIHHRENPQFIYDGRADAAPMYLHLASYVQAALPQAFDVVRLPQEGNAIDALGAAIIRSSPRPQAARRWVEFLRSEEAAAQYEGQGFDCVSREERGAVVVPG